MRVGVCHEREFHQGELNFEGSAGSASPSRVEWRPSQWPQAHGEPVKFKKPILAPILGWNLSAFGRF